MNSSNDEFYRFKAFVTEDQERPNASLKRGVGMAYVRDGNDLWTLKLWMFPESRFYLLPDKNAAGRMLIFTRELKKKVDAKAGKYFWNLVGQVTTIAALEVMRLDFDLFDRPVFINIFPEQGANTDVSEIRELKRVG